MDLFVVAIALALWITLFLAAIRMFSIDRTLKAILAELRAARPVGGSPAADGARPAAAEVDGPTDRVGATIAVIGALMVIGLIWLVALAK